MVKLVTIPHSSYCEAARWALDAARIAYSEDAYPLLRDRFDHLPVVMSMRTQGFLKGWLRIWRPTSLPGGGWEGYAGVQIFFRTAVMVPCALTPDDECLGDSFEIVQWAFANCAAEAKLGDATNANSREFDAFGAAVRNMCYTHMYTDTETDRAGHIKRHVDWYCCVGDEALHKQMLADADHLWDKYLVAQSGGFRMKSERLAAKAVAQISATFDSVATRLRETGKPFLGGDAIGAEDIIFAAHASWLFFPANCGAGTCTRNLTFDGLPAAYQDKVREWKSHPAGEHALMLYEQHRRFPRAGCEVRAAPVSESGVGRWLSKSAYELWLSSFQASKASAPAASQ